MVVRLSGVETNGSELDGWLRKQVIWLTSTEVSMRCLGRQSQSGSGQMWPVDEEVIGGCGCDPVLRRLLVEDNDLMT
jgi:hypothetical protein